MAALWAFVVFLACFFLVGLGWGVLWNKKWGIGNHLGAAGANFVLSLIAAAFALAFAGADASLPWLDSEREVAIRTLTESGSLNREALRDAWVKLSPLGKQNDLTGPQDGGNELRLTNQEDAKTLAGSAASLVKRHLVKLNPYDFGTTCFARDPSTVAEDVLTSVETPHYPIVVRPDNAWTKAAIVSQVGSAFDTTQRSARASFGGFKFNLILAIGIIVAVQMILTAAVAVSDIQVDPKTERTTARA